MMDENIETFFDALRKESPDEILIVGIGNTLKADDGIGPQICTRLKSTIPNNVIEAGIVPENYIQAIIKKAPRIILFIDAIDFGSSAGSIRVFNPSDLSTTGISTHTLPPRLLTNIIAQKTGARIYFIGIQPKSTKMGHPMSPEIESAKKELCFRLTKLLYITRIC